MSLDPKLTRACYIRDGWRCRHCRNRNGLHPHHVIYQSHQGPDELWNLITLCAQCHIEGVHGGRLRIEYADDFATEKHNQVRFVRVKSWQPK